MMVQKVSMNHLFCCALKPLYVRTCSDIVSISSSVRIMVPVYSVTSVLPFYPAAPYKLVMYMVIQAPTYALLIYIRIHFIQSVLIHDDLVIHKQEHVQIKHIV